MSNIVQSAKIIADLIRSISEFFEKHVDDIKINIDYDVGLIFVIKLSNNYLWERKFCDADFDYFVININLMEPSFLKKITT